MYDGKEEPSSEIPQSRQISRTSMSPITSLVLKSENRKVVIPNQKQGLYQPISILKNRIRPRNPSFPDKWLVSYENLKEKENWKMAKLSRNIHETCQYMLESNNYIKTPKDIDWDKQVEGTDFYERQEKFNIMKQSKMQMLKSSIAQKETSQCTFQPDLSKTSPLRRPPS